MTFKDKASKVFAELIVGAVLILAIVPGALFIMRLVSGSTFELPYILWPVLYAIYVYGILRSASTGELFRKH